MSVYANAANEDDRITKQFQKLFEKPREADDVGETGEACEADDTSPRQNTPLQFFNITDNIIDRIDDRRFLTKLSFRDCKAYATSIIFNRALVPEKIDELYSSIVDGYKIPFTIDAVYDKKSKIDDKCIKIINGNHRYGAICKYITEHDKHFDCKYNVYVMIYVVDDCETTNITQSIELYTKINNHLPFNAPIIIDINVMTFLNKLCSPETKSAYPIMKAILENKRCTTCHQPNINKKEVFEFLDKNKDILESLVSKYTENKNNLIITEKILEIFIENITTINHRLSLKDFNNLYSNNQSAQNRQYFDKAVKIGFFLNLKTSNYPKEKWIAYLINPDDI